MLSIDSLVPGIWMRFYRNAFLFSGQSSVSSDHMIISSDWGHGGLSDDKPVLLSVMAWCCQAANHYLDVCWPELGHSELSWFDTPRCILGHQLLMYMPQSKSTKLFTSWHSFWISVVWARYMPFWVQHMVQVKYSWQFRFNAHMFISCIDDKRRQVQCLITSGTKTILPEICDWHRVIMSECGELKLSRWLKTHNPNA